MHNRVGLDDLSAVFFFIASRQLSHDSSDRVRVPAWPHGVRDHPGVRFLVPTSFSRVYRLIPPVRKGEGAVGDGMFGHSHDAVPLVQVDHGRLDGGVAQHGLEHYQPHTELPTRLQALMRLHIA
jgi:hypothetical protein